MLLICKFIFKKLIHFITSNSQKLVFIEYVEATTPMSQDVTQLHKRETSLLVYADDSKISKNVYFSYESNRLLFE